MNSLDNDNPKFSVLAVMASRNPGPKETSVWGHDGIHSVNAWEECSGKEETIELEPCKLKKGGGDVRYKSC